jgi:cytochrome c553
MRLLPCLFLLATVVAAPAAAQDQDPPEFPEVAKPCVTCHGHDGLGRSPGFPNICGQKSIYMMQQLTMFRDKERHSEVMNITAANLTDEDIRVIAEYYESQPACK